MLLLRYTAGSILLFCLGSACSFPIPWEGPILLWTGGPDPNSHLLLLQHFIPGHWAVNATLSHVSQNIIFDMKASPGLSPQTAAIARHPRNHAPLTLLYTCISRSISLLP